MRPVLMALPLIAVTISACSSGTPLEPVRPAPASVKPLTFEIWPLSVPEEGPSTYGTRLYLQASNGTVHVNGVTLSLAGNDQTASGLECGPLPSRLSLVVGYPKLVDDTSICRVNAPIGASAESATLVVNYSDDHSHTGIFRSTVALLSIEPALELQEFTIKKVPYPSGGTYYEPTIVVRETRGTLVTITTLKVSAGNAAFDTDCPWQAQTVSANATWSTSSLGYCAPYLYTTAAPATVTMDLAYVSQGATATPRTLHATANVGP